VFMDPYTLYQIYLIWTSLKQYFIDPYTLYQISFGQP
jgi:hypothetical protein